MIKVKSCNLSSSEAKCMLSCAFQNALETAQKNSEAYIALNPGDAERRQRDLQIEILGINNLYFRMMDEIDHAIRISGTTQRF